MNFLYLSTLVCLFAVAVQSQEMTREVEKRGRRLCGYHLTQALALVCEGAYNVQFGKRGGDGIDLQEEGYDYEQFPSSSLAWPFLSRQSANSLLQRDDFHSRFRRQSHGVVDECCYKSCDFSTLRSYCAKKKA